MKVLSLSYALFLCLIANLAFGQKVGHVNTVMLIDSLPAAKQASITLKQYEASLSKTGEEMVAKFQEKLKKYQQDVATGNLTPLQRKQTEEDLEIDQNAIGSYRQSAQTSLEKRRQELIQPILDKINAALQAIGKEEQYLFIFDSAAGILFFRESEDISAKLFTRLAAEK